MNNEIVFEIKKHIGVIEEFQTGWTKEINLVAWNGNEPKYDIRDWNDDHTRMSRGITLSEKQMDKILRLVQEKAQEIKGVMSTYANKSNREQDMER